MLYYIARYNIWPPRPFASFFSTQVQSVAMAIMPWWKGSGTAGYWFDPEPEGDPYHHPGRRPAGDL